MLCDVRAFFARVQDPPPPPLPGEICLHTGRRGNEYFDFPYHNIQLFYITFYPKYYVFGTFPRKWHSCPFFPNMVWKKHNFWKGKFFMKISIQILPSFHHLFIESPDPSVGLCWIKLLLSLQGGELPTPGLNRIEEQ